MSELRRKIDDFLLVGRVALDNAQQSPEIAEAVARYGSTIKRDWQRGKGY